MPNTPVIAVITPYKMFFEQWLHSSKNNKAKFVWVPTVAATHGYLFTDFVVTTDGNSLKDVIDAVQTRLAPKAYSVQERLNKAINQAASKGPTSVVIMSEKILKQLGEEIGALDFSVRPEMVCNYTHHRVILATNLMDDEILVK